MDNVKKKVVTKRSFPDYLAPDEEKVTEEYGLEFGKAIEAEWWLKPDSGQSPYFDRRERFHELRLYARGEQDTKLYKEMIAGSGDTSYSSYDWSPLQTVPKFVKLLSNQMTERLFDIKAEAQDKFSTDLKNTYRENLMSIVDMEHTALMLKEMIGVDPRSKEEQESPRTKEEIELAMELEYKPAIEIATEQAIKFTLEMNDYDECQTRMIEDVVTLGVCAAKHRTDPNKGIIVEYVDPAECVHSYAKHRDFKNVHYFGEVERITVNELKRLSGNKFTDEELKEIAGSTSEWNKYNQVGNSADYREDDLQGLMVDVLHFTFKSTKKLSYKKKYTKNGGFKMNKKESSFKKGEGDKGFDVSQKDIDCWYEGTLILGSDRLFNYRLCENMIRPKGNLHKTLPNYLFYAPDMYQNKPKSLVGNIIPYVNQMQQIHIKLQQLIAKARPNGVFIDIDGLSEIPLGDGSFLTPLEVIKIYDETGNVLGASRDTAGDYNYGKEPIRELKNGVVDGIDRLVGAYNHYLGMLRDSIGVPQGADASTPHPKMAVGVQEQLAASMNTATRHVLDSVLNVTERVGESLCLRLQDIFEYSDLKKVYTQAIGKINVGVLESMKNFHLHDMGINIMLKPDAQERQFLEQNIQVALSKDSITLDDAQEVRQTPNIKQANMLLRIRRKQRERDMQEQQMALQEQQAQQQMELQQMQAQAEAAKLQGQIQLKMAEAQAKTQSKLAEIKAEEEAKARLMQQEFDYNMQLKGLEQEQINEMKRYENDRKDSRQREAATQSSKINEQKQFKKPSLNFESSEDSIGGGIEMGEMEPQ